MAKTTKEPETETVAVEPEATVAVPVATLAELAERVQEVASYSVGDVKAVALRVHSRIKGLMG